MKQVPILYACLSFITQLCFSQNEANIWYFGKNAGIDFNSGAPINRTDGTLNTFEGCATVCDSNGNLLFYTDGISIWNRKHKIMPNGNGLMGDKSSTQSATIVKKPNSTTNYYVFTVDDVAGINGLRYSEVNMGLQAGMGDVNINKNKPLVSPTCEKLVAIKHYNNKDYWIITQLFGASGFNSFLLTENGVSTAGIYSNVGSLISDSLETPGYLKASVDGNKVVSAINLGNYIEIFDFNNSTGILTNPIKIKGFGSGSDGLYGVEFSPNGNVLYVSLYTPAEVYQLNLIGNSFAEIENSRLLISSIFSSSTTGGALQLGPDGKIYMARGFSEYLAVINNPNAVGPICNFESEGFFLGGKTCYFGLPNFSSSLFILEETIVEMPNVFTPNNDGNNDVFLPLHTEWLDEANLSIYNRWGVNLYKSKLLSGWDGRISSGLEAPEGIYYYIVSYNESLRKKGFVSLIR